jgi:hypothetical protein
MIKPDITFTLDLTNGSWALAENMQNLSLTIRATQTLKLLGPET